MVLGIGCDIIEISRIKASLHMHGQHFLDRIFVPAEQSYCQKYRNPVPHFAARWAAKEAIVKALGTGISAEVSWLDIEICNASTGKPHPILSPKVINLFNNPEIHLTLSHSKEYAMAVALWSK
jgi:holo-[acyl-carrier protein] synthase